MIAPACEGYNTSWNNYRSSMTGLLKEFDNVLTLNASCLKAFCPVDKWGPCQSLLAAGKGESKA